jgi:hypothetical protein
MTDYIIKSVDFNAIINGSVNSNIDTPGDTVGQSEKYDFAQYYVEISTVDIDVLNTYRIAFNQTRYLGNEGPPTFYNMEGYIGVFGQQAIMDALNNVLALDPGHDNFTIILGIYLYCEDNNPSYDLDDWTKLRFKTLNLTFSYVKRIDKGTNICWNQDLNEINGTSEAINVQIIDANLKFKYKIDTNWPAASQNSQIRIFINDRKFDQTISLIDYLDSPNFKDVDGYNIASKILPYENFTLTIQTYLAEDFGLEDNIMISITEVSLRITYRETFPDPRIPEPWVYAGLFILAMIAAVTATAYLIAYQMYLKYPIPIRKVRKYRKTLENEKVPNVIIAERKTSFNRIFQKEMSKIAKFLTGTPLDGKVIREKLLGK